MSWRKKEFKGKYLRDTNFSGMRVWKESEDQTRQIEHEVAYEYYRADCAPTLNEIRTCLLLCLLRSLDIKSASAALRYIGCDW